jgi:hypothetical protein
MTGGAFGRVRNDVPSILSRNVKICGAGRLHARRRPKSADTALWVLKTTKGTLGNHITGAPITILGINTAICGM